MAVYADALAERIRAGELAAVARAISLVERGAPAVPELARELFAQTGRARVLGVTGPPGAGKSTLVNAAIGELRARGRTVAVLAVDPSSPFTGGAVLGDRVRMTAHAGDEGVFIRSLANRGHLGGLALAVPQAIRILDAAGIDTIIVETVGVGQSEIAVVRAVDCTVVVMVPGAGDGVQAMKAGLMEIADLFVVNKADQPDAQRTRAELSSALRLARTAVRPQIAMTTATLGDGIPELVDAVDTFFDAAEASGALAERRARRHAEEIVERLAEHAVIEARRLLDSDAFAAELAARRDPAESAHALWQLLSTGA